MLRKLKNDTEIRLGNRTQENRNIERPLMTIHLGLEGQLCHMLPFIFNADPSGWLVPEARLAQHDAG